MLLYFFLISLGLFIAVSLLANYNAAQYAKGVGKRIDRMEKIYTDFLNSKIENEEFSSGDIRFDPEVLTKEAVQKLHPSLEGLLNFINRAYLSKVRIKPHSKYFPNVETLCEEAFALKNRNQYKRISAVETERFRMALYDAVYADLYQRILKKQHENKGQVA